MISQEELLQKKEMIENLTKNFQQAEKDTIVLKTKIEAAEVQSEELQEECKTKFGCDFSELPQLISKTSDEIEVLIKEIESTFGNVKPIDENLNSDTSGFNMFENKGETSNVSF